MVILLALRAISGQPVCDPATAARLLEDARIAEYRAPVTHPELVPGLALGSAHVDPSLRDALTALCAAPDTLSIAAGDRWEDAGWAAHTWILTASETVGCALVQRSLAVSVGIRDELPPVYRLRSLLPPTTTPIGDCATPPSWRDETVLAGGSSPVRVVLAVDRRGDEITNSAVIARRATAEGWSEQVLQTPAPPRLLGGHDGPLFTLVDGADRWIVAHGDREGGPDACRPVPEQTVWRWEADAWTPATGRDALTLLAQRGRWRLASSDGWLHIVAQDDENDAEVLAYRHARVQRRYPEPTYVFSSADLPGLNPGFLVIAPAPFPTEAQAAAAKKRWRSLRRHYVKRAWTAPDPCE